jgi:DNA modification methylase
MRIEIRDAITANHWEIAHELIWDKGNQQLCDPNEPYTIQTERLWVIHRSGDSLIDHGQDSPHSRSDILRFAPVQQSSLRPDDTHLFQKPETLCEFLVRKHSYPGELVFDPFGCSGSFTIAAGRLGRLWVYSESREENFRWGSQRIHDRLVAAD